MFFILELNKAELDMFRAMMAQPVMGMYDVNLRNKIDEAINEAQTDEDLQDI